MAIYSALGKCLLGLVIVGGGVTGAVLGINGSKSRSESDLTEHLVQQDNRNNISGLAEQPSTNPTNIGSSNNQNINHPVTKEEKPISQLSRGEEKKFIGPSHKESVAQQLKEVGPISVIDQEPKMSVPKSEKPNTPSLPKFDLKTPRPKPAPRRPRPTSRPTKVMEEPLVAKNEDFSSKNWFYVKWNDKNDLDDSAWTISECTKNINSDDAVFTCPWNEDQSKMIELHLSLSSDTDLKTKKWDDLEELTFSSKVANIATLELTFSDNRGEIITLFLERKNS